MTEDEWLAATDPDPLHWYVRDKASERLLRLFECACCRRVWDELLDERSRRAVEMAERYADGLATGDELEAVALGADKAWSPDDDQFEPEGHLLVAAAAYNVAIPMGWWGGAPAFAPPSSIVQKAATNLGVEKAAQTTLLRDIVGNPFRTVAVTKEWLTDYVVSLARQMYDSRDFSAMPILGDAIEDAGCSSDSILNHCRSSGPHVRGCWAIDLVLGCR